MTHGVKNSEQTVLNTSFDQDYNVLAVENLVYNPTTCEIDRMVQPASLITKQFDYVSMTISPTTTETYTFKSGGSGGTTTNTVVIVYTDATRTDISTITKT